MNRRTLLSTLGTVTAITGTASTAGCLGALGPTDDPSDAGRTDADPTDAGPTTADRPERVTTGDGHVVDLGTIDVQASILVMGVHTDVRAHNGTSFLRLPVTLEDADGSPITAPDPYEKIRESSSVRLDAGAHAQVVYDRTNEGPGVVLALAVPVGEYDDGEFRVGLGGGDAVHVPIPADALSAIADPAAFEVTSFEVEEPVEGETLEATVTVENVGGTAGRFLAELGPTSVSDSPEVTFDVGAHEEVREDVSVAFTVPSDSDEATIRLEWGVDELERTVAVASE